MESTEDTEEISRTSVVGAALVAARGASTRDAPTRARFRRLFSHFKNAGIFSLAIIDSKLSRAFTNSKALPCTITSAGSARVL